MNILVIPEDYVKDQNILKPVLSAMLKYLGKPRAKIEICQNPRLRGVHEALDWQRIQAIIRQYYKTDLFLICVDRDGNENRKESLKRLEELAGGILPAQKNLIAENAWQELEVWLLASHNDLGVFQMS